MKYIVFEYHLPYMFTPGRYEKHEIKTDKDLKEFLFKHQDNLKNIEIFTKSNKRKINFEVIISD